MAEIKDREPQPQQQKNAKDNIHLPFSKSSIIMMILFTMISLLLIYLSGKMFIGYHDRIAQIKAVEVDSMVKIEETKLEQERLRLQGIKLEIKKEQERQTTIATQNEPELKELELKRHQSEMAREKEREEFLLKKKKLELERSNEERKYDFQLKDKDRDRKEETKRMELQSEAIRDLYKFRLNKQQDQLKIYKEECDDATYKASGWLSGEEAKNNKEKACFQYDSAKADYKSYMSLDAGERFQRIGNGDNDEDKYDNM